MHPNFQIYPCQVYYVLVAKIGCERDPTDKVGGKSKRTRCHFSSGKTVNARINTESPHKTQLATRESNF